jgi:hypothetical protein
MGETLCLGIYSRLRRKSLSGWDFHTDVEAECGGADCAKAPGGKSGRTLTPARVGSRTRGNRADLRTCLKKIGTSGCVPGHGADRLKIDEIFNRPAT